MKIALAAYKIIDLGGIINHTEDLMYGLKRQGHTVDLLQLVYNSKKQRDRYSKDTKFSISESGFFYNQKTGWLFPKTHKIPYQGHKLKEAKKLLNQYDLVIWILPVPSKNNENMGNWEWKELYDLDKPVQLAFIHDGGACDRYPHVLEIQDKIKAFLCVHHSAIGGSDFISAPRFHVLNPFRDVNRPLTPWADRKSGFVSLQTFKALKHVDDLIAAIRYMPPKQENEYRDIYGLGIEYQYMTSPDKCKSAYFHDDGERIWDAAEENGMVHHSYIERIEVDKLLQSARVLVDPSWSFRLGARGGFYGRVFVEAAINGAVPVGRPLGIGLDLFKPNEHYVSIPMGADHQLYGEMVLEAGSDSEVNLSIREACRDLVQRFDADLIAKKVLSIADGSIKENPLPSSPREEMDIKSKEFMMIYFGEF